MEMDPETGEAAELLLRLVLLLRHPTGQEIHRLLRPGRPLRHLIERVILHPHRTVHLLRHQQDNLHRQLPRLQPGSHHRIFPTNHLQGQVLQARVVRWGEDIVVALPGAAAVVVVSEVVAAAEDAN